MHPNGLSISSDNKWQGESWFHASNEIELHNTINVYGKINNKFAIVFLKIAQAAQSMPCNNSIPHQHHAEVRCAQLAANDQCRPHHDLLHPDYRYHLRSYRAALSILLHDNLSELLHLHEKMNHPLNALRPL